MYIGLLDMDTLAAMRRSPMSITSVTILTTSDFTSYLSEIAQSNGPFSPAMLSKVKLLFRLAACSKKFFHKITAFIMQNSPIPINRVVKVRFFQES